jgi:hypothetical protein
MVTLDQAKAYAGINDVRSCRDAVHAMRRAGVAMPPALIALGALDLQYHQGQQQ